MKKTKQTQKPIFDKETWKHVQEYVLGKTTEEISVRDLAIETLKHQHNGYEKVEGQVLVWSSVIEDMRKVKVH